MKRSNRAKSNMTKQLKGRLTFLKSILLEKQKTLAKIRKFARCHLPGYSQMLRAEYAGVSKVKKDITQLKILIRRRQRNNECNKIL